MEKPLPPGVREEADGSLTMCSKKTSCPNILFTQDGGATISEKGETVIFTKDQLDLLSAILRSRT